MIPILEFRAMVGKLRLVIRMQLTDMFCMALLERERERVYWRKY